MLINDQSVGLPVYVHIHMYVPLCACRYKGNICQYVHERERERERERQTWNRVCFFPLAYITNTATLREGMEIVVIAFTSTISEFSTFSNFGIEKEPFQSCFAWSWISWQITDVLLFRKRKLWKLVYFNFMFFISKYIILKL